MIFILLLIPFNFNVDYSPKQDKVFHFGADFLYTVVGSITGTLITRCLLKKWGGKWLMGKL